MNTSNYRRGAIYLLAGFCLALLPARAGANGLIGTSVTGSLIFAGLTANYYDPANGYVPSGYENTAGTTVTVASPAVEFGFQDSGNTDLANFSASQFTIEDILSANAAVGGIDTAFTMSFTDPAFSGLGFAKATDSFPHGGLTYSITGTTITIHWAGGTINPNDDYTSTFTMATVPEPSTWAALVAGMGAVILALRRRALP